MWAATQRQRESRRPRRRLWFWLCHGAGRRRLECKQRVLVEGLCLGFSDVGEHVRDGLGRGRVLAGRVGARVNGRAENEAVPEVGLAGARHGRVGRADVGVDQVVQGGEIVVAELRDVLQRGLQAVCSNELQLLAVVDGCQCRQLVVDWLCLDVGLVLRSRGAREEVALLDEAVFHGGDANQCQHVSMRELVQDEGRRLL